MKLIYIANIRFPTEKAHGIQIAKMCEAFADLGVNTELVVTNRKTIIREDPFDYYKVKKVFKVTKLWCLDTVRFGQLGFWIETLSFAKLVLFYTVFKQGIFYTRDEFIACCLKILGKKVVWEAHMGHQNFFLRRLVKWRVPTVVISKGLKDLYIKLGMLEEKIIVSPDGVDLKQFNTKISQKEARKKLGFAEASKLAIYTGNLYSWKGVATLDEARNLLPKNIEVFIVSGKPHSEIPLYLRAADVLILPNSAKQDISRIYTSPMKLFEYMASGVPIISSDLPSIREVLNESVAYFFTPDDSKDLARVIRYIFSHTPEAYGKAKVALKEAEKYTWQKRVKKITDFILVMLY